MTTTSEKGRRTWTFWTFHNLWVLTNTNISTYMTGSSLIALGLTWWQAIIAIIVGACLSTLFIVLNSMPGAYYHLGFPIANRYVSPLSFLPSALKRPHGHGQTHHEFLSVILDFTSPSL